jgi:hypothetical protein
MAKQKSGGISLRPSDAEATGLLNDIDAKITAAVFEMYDYGGDYDENPALHLTLEDEDGNEHEQYWSAGSSERLLPNDDGTKLIPAEGKKAKGTGKKTNLFKLLQSLEKADFDFDKADIDSDITNLVGLEAHWERIPSGSKKDDGSDADVLVVTEIKKNPWDKGGKSKPKKDDKKASTKKGKKDEDEDEEEEEDEDEDSDSDDDDDDEEFDAKEAALEVVGEVLADNEDGLIRKKLIDAVFKKINKRPKDERKAILELVNDDDFYEDEDQEVFTVDKKSKKIVPA